MSVDQAFGSGKVDGLEDIITYWLFCKRVVVDNRINVLEVPGHPQMLPLGAKLTTQTFNHFCPW